MPFSSKGIVYGTEMALHSSKKALQYASKAAWEHCLYQELGRFGTLYICTIGCNNNEAISGCARGTGIFV